MDVSISDAEIINIHTPEALWSSFYDRASSYITLDKNGGVPDIIDILQLHMDNSWMSQEIDSFQGSSPHCV